jgi:hypothetical protein
MVCGLLWLGGLGCATTQTGATVDDLAAARNKATPGATTFTNECASCHGQRGEGLAGAPAILGPGALPDFPRSLSSGSDPTIFDPQQIQIQAQTRPAGAASRDRFRNALDLYNFTLTHLPKNRAQQLKDADYWGVVTFLLAAQGAALPPEGIGPANAASIPIPRK